MFIPPGTPFLVNPQAVMHTVNPDDPELCPDCGHVTLFRFRHAVLHEGGVVDAGWSSACGSDECAD